MKILAPLSKAEYLDKLIDAGADEFYMGFRDEDWERHFGKYADLNRMSGFGGMANPCDFQELLKLIRCVKDKNRAAFVTMNANCYSAEQIAFMESHYFPALLDARVDGLIVSDLPIIAVAERFGLHTVASTMCAVYNFEIARVYYQAGVRRMILPRDLTLNEIQRICAALPDVRFEAFFMRNGCIFSDCYCLGLHRPECGAACTYMRFSNKNVLYAPAGFSNEQDVCANDYLYNRYFHIEACAMCSLYRLKEIGIASLKIVGRADDFAPLREDIALTRKNLAHAKCAATERDYLEQMSFPLNYPRKCLFGMSCYYPETRFGEVPYTGDGI